MKLNDAIFTKLCLCSGAPWSSVIIHQYFHFTAPRVRNPADLFLFLKKNVRLTKVKPIRREREVAAAQERREKEEEPAGESGMDTRNDSVRFEDD